MYMESLRELGLVSLQMRTPSGDLIASCNYLVAEHSEDQASPISKVYRGRTTYYYCLRQQTQAAR